METPASDLSGSKIKFDQELKGIDRLEAPAYSTFLLLLFVFVLLLRKHGL